MHNSSPSSPKKNETGAEWAMEGNRCQEAGTQDLNLGVLVSSRQNHSGEGTQSTLNPVETRANQKPSLVKLPIYESKFGQFIRDQLNFDQCIGTVVVQKCIINFNTHPTEKFPLDQPAVLICVF